MQHVVAEVTEQDCIVSIDSQYIAKWMVDTGEYVDLFGVGNDAFWGVWSDGHSV